MIRVINIILISTILILSCPPAHAAMNLSRNGDSFMGLPVGGGGEDADLSLCPAGARVVQKFLESWGSGDFKTMYDLIDDDSKQGYPFQQARFDFQFMEFREYTISSVARSGDDFEFILTYGDWRDGDKITQKVLVSGRTFKIIMPRQGALFTKSIDSYFN